MKEPIIITTRWPSILGHAGGVETISGWKRAESEDGELWLVRERGLVGFFRGSEWLPVEGHMVKLRKAIWQ